MESRRSALAIAWQPAPDAWEPSPEPNRRRRYTPLWTPRIIPGFLNAIALVGSRGAAVQAASGVALTTWAYGQTPTAGNTLVATVTVTGSATLPTTPSGWSIGKQVAGTSTSATVYYKVAAGSDGVPTIAAITSGLIAGQLSEYSGVGLIDQSGSATSTSSPVTATAGGANAATGELLICAGADCRSTARASNDTWTSNDGTVTLAGSNNGTSSVNHYSFGAIVGTTATTAQTSVMTLSITTSITGLAVVNVSFKLGATTWAIAAAGAAVASGTGALISTEVIAGAGGAVSGGSGSLGVFDPIAAAGVAASSGVGALTNADAIFGVGAATAGGTADIEEFNPIAATGAATSTGTAALIALDVMAGTGAATAGGVGALIATDMLAATGAAVATGTGALKSTEVMAGTGAASAAGTAALIALDVMTAAGSAVATGSGDITIAGVGPTTWAIAAAGAATAAGTGAITTSQELDAAGGATAGGVGALKSTEALAGTGASTAAGSASLAVLMMVAGAAAAQAGGSGSLTLILTLAASGAAQAGGLGDLLPPSIVIPLYVIVHAFSRDGKISANAQGGAYHYVIGTYGSYANTTYAGSDFVGGSQITAAAVETAAQSRDGRVRAGSRDGVAPAQSRSGKVPAGVD